MASILRAGAQQLQPAARLGAVRAFGTSALRSSPVEPFFSNEPQSPVVQTSIPGPKNKAAAKELDQVFDIRSLNLLADYSKSIGN